MGRELRRVPLDFNWPLDQTWKGFVNPYYEEAKCPSCENSSGYTHRYQMLEEFLRRLWIAAEESALRPDDYKPQRSLVFQVSGTHQRWFFDTDPVDVLSVIPSIPCIP